ELGEDVRERPLTGPGRSTLPIQEIGEAALRRGDPTLRHHLVVAAAMAQRHDARHRMPVLGHLDRLAAPHPTDHPAEVRPQVPYSNPLHRRMILRRYTMSTHESTPRRATSAL